jgi:hypothetical protein
VMHDHTITAVHREVHAIEHADTGTAGRRCSCVPFGRGADERQQWRRC